jgi:cytosine/adenosine deaminase-related metal-dependent hydrolase
MIIRRVHLVGGDTGPRDIVVSGPTIERLCEPSATPLREGPVLDFGDAIAFPGLTNSHDHLEFNVYPALGHGRYADYVEWGEDIQRRDREVISRLERVPRAYRLRWGALKNLLCGVTTVAQHGDGREDLTGIPIDTVHGTAIHSVHAAPRWRWRLNGLIDRSPYVFHVGEGTSSRARDEIDELIRWNLFRRPLIGIHAIAMHAEQAARFHAVVWCPVSNEFLYGTTADVVALKRTSAILFGTDSTLTGDWNLWNHLRRARALGGLDDRELFESVTRKAAVVWRRARMGRVAPGHVSDLVVARKKAHDAWDAFFAVDPEDILLVLKRGVVVLCDDSVDAVPASGIFSVIRLGARRKRVAEDVAGILAGIRACGIEPNLPFVAEHELVRPVDKTGTSILRG